MSKSCRNTVFGCSDHFFEFPNRFPIGFGHIKVYKLDFEIFAIFGHSDTVSSIWKSMFLHQNAPNSCKKMLETHFCSVLIIFLSFAIDSWRLLGPKNGINSILRFSWFFDPQTCLDAEILRFWEPKWNSVFRDLRKMRFKKPRKTFFDPKIALVHQKCARFS